MSAAGPPAWFSVAHAAMCRRLVVTGSEPDDYGEIQPDGSVTALSAHEALWVAALLLAGCLEYERKDDRLLITATELGSWFLVMATTDVHGESGTTEPAPDPAAWFRLLHDAMFGRIIVTRPPPGAYMGVHWDKRTVVALSEHDGHWVTALLAARCLTYEPEDDQFVINPTELGVWFLVLASLNLTDADFANSLLSRAAKHRPTEPQ
jgi:hypothetical protein